MVHSRKRSLLVVLSCAAGALLPAEAAAAGFLFYEVGTSEIGSASTGYVTRASSASTLLTNPAGMTLLQGTQVQVGTTLVYGHLKFAPDSGTDPSLGSNDGGNAVGLLPTASVFAIFSPTETLRLGIGVFSNFGAPQHWDPAWVGRYYTTKTTLLGFSIMPALAWRIHETFSVGATVNIMSGHLRQTVALRNLEPQTPDGTLEASADTWGVGANAGILWAPLAGTRLGLIYTSPVRLNFTSAPGLGGLGAGLGGIIDGSRLEDATLDLGMTVPQTVMLGFSQAITPSWTITGDVGWQNWAAFGAVDIGLSTPNPRSLTTHIAYQDTWHVGVGAEMQLPETWRVRFGVAYDSSMTTDESRTLSLSLASQLRFGVGAQVDVDRHWQLAFSTELLLGGSPRVDVDRGALAGHVSGNYNSTWLLFTGFSFTWKA